MKRFDKGATVALTFGNMRDTLQPMTHHITARAAVLLCLIEVTRAR